MCGRNFVGSYRAMLALGALIVAAFGATAHAQSAGVSGGNARQGVLLLAHGGSKEWNGNVQGIAEQVDKTEPTEVALGMADRTTLQAGIDKLTSRGVTEIIAVPLFVSSHSSVIEATRYLLGMRADAPPELADFAMPMDHGAMAGHANCNPADPAKVAEAAAEQAAKTTPVKSAVPIHMAAALDRHRILAEILSERAAAISHDAKKEEVILVAHGPNDDRENAMWLADLGAVAQMIAAKKSYAAIEVATVRDDAEDAVREEATKKLRGLVSAANEKNLRVLIVPVLLSYGGIENGIRKRLDGLDHVFSPAGLLPDPKAAEWVKASAGEIGGGK